MQDAVASCLPQPASSAVFVRNAPESESGSINPTGSSFHWKDTMCDPHSSLPQMPSLSLDDFLDVLHPDHFQSPLSTPSSSPQPRDLAFQIIRRIIESHLSKGLLDNIIIDSPLSSRSHLDQLIQVAASFPNTRVVIIECKPNNVYKWQTDFEKHVEAHSESLTEKWYKAKDWNEVVQAVHDDYDERADGYKVSKLVFDPFSSYQTGLCENIYFSLWKGESVQPPDFVEAVNYMITREESLGPDVVVNQWRQSKYLPPSNEKVVKDDDGSESGQTSTREQRFCSGGRHSITNYTEKLVLEYEEAANCLVCEQKITGAAYTCTACSIALHEECVEPSPTLQPPHITEDRVWLPCASCKQDEVSKSIYNCESCMFEVILRKLAYERVVSVIRHDCEEHFLWVDASSSSDIVQCRACGDREAYRVYSCKICGVSYDYECLTEVARLVKHVHGGHHHHMLLKFSSEEGEEDYMCHECLEKRDPQLWFYSCEDCVYEIHLGCARNGIEQDEEKSQSVKSGSQVEEQDDGDDESSFFDE